MRGFALTVFGAGALEQVLLLKLAAKPGDVLVRHHEAEAKRRRC
jgi:hypothetical protein